MFRYPGAGLPNIYLRNGYDIRETPYGEAVAIEDVEGLHRAIARDIAFDVAPGIVMSGAEFRFLRKELDLSQKRVGALLGVAEQTVSLWERASLDVPVYADVIVRALMREYLSGDAELQKLIHEMSERDRQERDTARREFAHGREWGLAA